MSGTNGLGELAGRLTDPHDRETYSHLVTYVHTLPPGDEFRRLAQLLGLLTLLGQRVPDALAEHLAELRSLSQAAAEHYALVDKRLASLPEEIADGVDVTEIAEAMSEAFRQQISSTGLQESAMLLRASVAEITALSNQMAAALKPATRELQQASTVIVTEVAKLTAASSELRAHNAQLIERERSSTWLWMTTLGLVLLLAGIIGGIFINQKQTAGALLGLHSQVDSPGQPEQQPPDRPEMKGKNK